MANKIITPWFFLILAGVALSSCNAQEPQNTPSNNTNTLVGGRCESCDLMYIGMPEYIPPVDTSAAWNEPGEKLLISGKVLKIDGRTPAPGITIYYWHTDHQGYYSPKEGMDSHARRHGYIRGWMKSDEQGRYALYTIRPGAYPNNRQSAHIHVLIKEPDIANEYYIDEWVFEDDPLLTPSYRSSRENRGGSGILRTEKKGDLLVAEHDIVLGLNVPGYPSR